MGIKLDIGSSENGARDGFVEIDIKLDHDVLDLPYAEKTVEEIYSSHILEHLSFSDVRDALRHWFALLEPGGKLYLAIPDFDKIDMTSDIGRFNLMGGQTDADDFHRSMWTQKSIADELGLAGFVIDEKAEWPEVQDCSSLEISQNIVACKPSKAAAAVRRNSDLQIANDAATEQYEDIKIVAVLATPRLGFTDFWGSCTDALTTMQIPIWRYSSCFWQQGMQGMIEMAIEQDIDWLLCLDFDSLFTAEDVSEMLRQFAANPEFDALAPLQCSRGKAKALVTDGDGRAHEREVTMGVPLEVATAHFGLTLLRLDSIKDLPKPWLQGAPDKDGSFGPDRIDGDIAFWNLLKKHGRKLGLAANVNIGHMELMYSQYEQTEDGGLEVKYRHVSEWHKQNQTQEKCKAEDQPRATS